MAVFDSLTEIMLIRIRLVLYCTLVFFSFFIIGGVAAMKDNADSYCPLYMDRAGLNFITYSESSCNYAFFVAIVCQLFYCVGRIVCLILFIIGRVTADWTMFSNILQRTYVSTEMVFCFLVFVCACVLSAGTNSTCSLISDCDSVPWSSGSKAAQAGAWLSTFLYVAACLFGVLYLMRTDNLPFFSSRRTQDPVSTVSSATMEGGAGVGPEAPHGGHPDAPPSYDDITKPAVLG